MNKRLFELKKELRQVKKMMDKHNRYCKKKGFYPKMFMNYEWGNKDNYYFITSDGCGYSLCCDSIEFPDIDISKIIYVNCDISIHYIKKKNNKIYSPTIKYNSYDSLRGFYNIEDDFAYLQKIDNKFNVKEIK